VAGEGRREMSHGLSTSAHFRLSVAMPCPGKSTLKPICYLGSCAFSLRTRNTFGNIVDLPGPTLKTRAFIVDRAWQYRGPRVDLPGPAGGQKAKRLSAAVSDKRSPKPKVSLLAAVSDKLKADNKGGALLGETIPHGGGRPSKKLSHDATVITLPDVGLTRTQSSRWQSKKAQHVRKASPRLAAGPLAGWGCRNE
jgi:hypothetical protein